MDDYEIDYGNLGFDDTVDFGGLSGFDYTKLNNLDLGNLNFDDSIDFSKLLDSNDLSNLSGTGLSDEDMMGLLKDANQDLDGMGTLNRSDRFNLDELLNGDKGSLTRSLAGNDTSSTVDESFLKNLSPKELEQYKLMQATGADTGLVGDQANFENQNVSKLWQPDYEKQWEANPNKLTSDWQKTSDGRYIQIRDADAPGGETTAIGFDQDGNSFSLNQSQVKKLVDSGELNSFKSGYNTATGGNKIAPGGGKMTVDANGNKTWTMPNGNTITQKPDGTTTQTTPGGKTTTTSPSGQQTTSSQNDWMKYLMMLMALDAMRNKGDSNQAVIPRLSGERSQTPYAAIQQAAGYRPGQGGIKYFSDVTRKAAGGGIGSLAGVGSVDSAGGRLLRGPGDGVSDSIKAQIGDHQPARLADGEYVLDARTVSEIGNGSTEAGAKKLAAMVSRIQQSRRHAKRGKPSNADKHLLA